ncbi:lytic transglycosylase domain-containing protein, partial [Patulibacter sp. S7RM1-6]
TPASAGAATATTTTAAAASGSGAGTAPASGARVTASDVGSVAAQNGVPASLARAIAWQESGFNNGAVSSVGARGVMQVMPGTWDWIGRNLSSTPLDPSSASDNVRAGTLYLGHLLRETGGDADLAAAAYYQGLSSVRSRGMYDDTQQYVRSVRALRSRFGD